MRHQPRVEMVDHSYYTRLYSTIDRTLSMILPYIEQDTGRPGHFLSLSCSIYDYTHSLKRLLCLFCLQSRNSMSYLLGYTLEIIIGLTFSTHTHTQHTHTHTHTHHTHTHRTAFPHKEPCSPHTSSHWTLYSPSTTG